MLGHADIIHGFATHAPALGRARRIVTLFDVFSALPSSAEWQEPRSRRRKKRQYRALARTCRHVIAISEATRRDFVQFTGYPEERIDVVYGGISSNYTPGAAGRRAELVKQYSLPERYAFYLGAPVARKNVNRLIEAYAQSGITGEIDLVIGGSTTAGTEPLMALARDLAIADRVHFIGYVREEDKPGLYACAEAFLFPTFYEGLGLPLLEAMACGTPVMAGNRGAAPEIVSKYGVIVNPYDTRGIAAGIGEVVGMGAAVEAVPYAQAFTWQRCAEETVAVYERVMAANSNEWMRAQ